MSARLRVGVFGAGSIGCYVGGLLLAAGSVDVVLVGRPRVEREAREHGLRVQDFAGPVRAVPAARVTFATATGALADCDVVLCCVKSQHSEDAARDLASVLREDAIVVSLQNGVRNPDTLRAGLGPRPVVASIVSWNVIAVEGVYRRATSGPLVVERTAHARMAALIAALRAAGVPVVEEDELLRHQWTKLLVNLNNAVSALTDVPTGRLILEPAYRRIVAAVVREGVQVARAAGIRPARFNGVPLTWMPRLLGLPTPIVKVITRRQLKVDPAARSSMWQDLAADRPTEVEYLNGEIVSLAAKAGAKAPLNARVCELVHAAEAAHAGSPALSAADLWSRLTA